jgi:hypothetical protein
VIERYNSLIKKQSVKTKQIDDVVIVVKVVVVIVVKTDFLL